MPRAFPERRTIPDNAVISNSVAIRLAGEVDYHPPNLHVDDSGHLAGYRTEPVVAAPKAFTAGGG